MPIKSFKCTIMGPPSCGKHSIAKKVVDCFGLVHISISQLIRREIRNKSEFAEEIEEHIKDLVPDDIVMELLLKEMGKYPNDKMVIEGFPRNLKQALEFSKLQKFTTVFNVVVPFEVLVETLKNRYIHEPSGRTYTLAFNPPKSQGKDDLTGEALIVREDIKLDYVFNRLRSHEKRMLPVLDYYRNVGVLREFKGKNPDEVWPKIRDHIENFLPKIKHID